MNIVKWLRGLQDKLLYLVVFSVGNLGSEHKNPAILTRKLWRRVRILKYRTLPITFHDDDPMMISPTKASSVSGWLISGAYIHRVVGLIRRKLMQLIISVALRYYKGKTTEMPT